MGAYIDLDQWSSGSRGRADHAVSGPSAITITSIPLFDVVSGSNGSCGGSYLCTGVLGRDGPTGNGTPAQEAQPESAVLARTHIHHPTLDVDRWPRSRPTAITTVMFTTRWSYLTFKKVASTQTYG